MVVLFVVVVMVIMLVVVVVGMVGCYPASVMIHFNLVHAKITLYETPT